MRILILLSSICALILFSSFNVNEIGSVAKPDSDIWKADTSWAQNKLATMSLDQKLGQLFMVAAYSNKGESHVHEIEKLIKNESIGGLIFFQGGPVRQARLTNKYQDLSNIPLMIGMDAEWGLAMRLDSTFKYPWPITMGAMPDSSLVYEFGKQMAEQCKRLGVHINFAPVVDINTNPKNPIINARSFGEDPEKVTSFSLAYMKGMQDHGVLACAKHFPGHGDTESDSHKTLPTVSHPIARLKEIELYPYSRLFKQGLGSVMIAHLDVPALDNTNTPTSLSPAVVKGLLKDSLGFSGLVFTDALNMKGVAKANAPGDVDLKALVAGNDILLFAEDVSLAKKKITQAIKDSLISMEEIDAHVLKILQTKFWLGLDSKPQIALSNIVDELNPEEARILEKQIYREAVSVLNNKAQILPLKELTDYKIALLTSGTDVGTEFHDKLNYYSKVDLFEYNGADENRLLNQLSFYDLVIVANYTSNKNPWKSYKIGQGLKKFSKNLARQTKLVFNHFGNPYALIDFPEAERFDALMVSYQNHAAAEEAAAQIIFGALGSKGSLPVSVSDNYEFDFGLRTKSLGRMGFRSPGEEGLNLDKLGDIDRLLKEAMDQGATPGAQVLVARNGNIVYHKSFGYHTYSKNSEVQPTDIYDLASITKITATLPLLMQLVEKGKVDLDKTLGDYLQDVKGTNKEDLVIREILAHKAGLQPWIPFYVKTLENGNLKPSFYSNQRSFDYPNTVAENLFSIRSIRDTVYSQILESELLTSRKYKYSDLGYYLLMEMIEQIEQEPIEVLVQSKFYQPLGAYSMGYNPLNRYRGSNIVPTEQDDIFRKQLISGHVHDQGAAMLGGVAGHAGVFSNAVDLAKIMQMYLNGGFYAGQQFLDRVTLNEFTRCQYCNEDNRRGIGFDKPQLDEVGPTCGCLSMKSFGHTGFTGTIAWADPDESIVYILLANRVNPDSNNKKFLRLSTRTKVQQVIYDAIENSQANTKILGSIN